MRLRAIPFVLLMTACALPDVPKMPATAPIQAPDSVTFDQVAPILNNRCVACHSCLESPCQLNMQSFHGVRRGAFHNNAYDGLRVSAVPPQRMFEDAQNEREWRDRGFVDVLSGGTESILLKTVRLSNLTNRKAPTTPVKERMACPQSGEEVTATGGGELAMPYGLRALPPQEQHLLSAWIAGGARAPAPSENLKELPKSIRAEIKSWQTFFNAKDLRSQITARYLYEHLFLAHLYFKQAPREFFRLVRSSTACDDRITPIATRRPNDSPGRKEFFYCLKPEAATVVYKNHLPYALSPEKLKWLTENFFATQWTITSLPSYEPAIASNPFETFRDIPVDARFKFLLEDAHYEVMTFIKGPVCNGSQAVNSIQEQFYVFFMDPKAELMVRYPEFANRVSAHLILPGKFGPDSPLKKIASGHEEIMKNRGATRAQFNRQYEIGFPEGLRLSDLWDGGGQNDNAVLTVFRNDDNAKVYKGAVGDTPKTVFVLDYSTFERLVYNLVINFDVFGNVSHQTLTRLYMDVLRMDAEDNFLHFLSPQERQRNKEAWYQGWLTRARLRVLKENRFANIPAAIALPADEDAKTALLKKFLFERLNQSVRGPADVINWKTLGLFTPTDPVEIQLRRIAAVRDSERTPFANFFPELSLLMVERSSGLTDIYSILRNREHENIAWILNENGRLAPKEDTLTIVKGVAGGYPMQFFFVKEAELNGMIDVVLNLKSEKQFVKGLKPYAIERMDERFWGLYDFANGYLLRKEPAEAGILDLSRYKL